MSTNVSFLWLCSLLGLFFGIQNVSSNVITYTVALSSFNSEETFYGIYKGSAVGSGDPTSNATTLINSGVTTYRSDINISAPNVQTVEIEFYDQMGRFLSEIQSCSVSSTTIQCGSDSFSEINEYDDVILHSTNVVLMSVIRKRYYSTTPLLGNLILTGNVAVNVTGVHLGCKAVSPANIVNASVTTIEECVDSCQSLGKDYAAVGNSKKCVCPTLGDFATAATDCTELCVGKQKCGSASNYNVYNVQQYNAFETILKTALDGSVQVGSTNITTETNDTQMPITNGKVSSLTIVEEEECYLTNIYFNTSSPGYYISAGCAPNSVTSLKTLSGSIEFYPDKTNRIHLGLVQTDCLTISPIVHNFTFHRAEITAYGPASTDFGVAYYMALVADILEEESSSISSSSSIEMSSSSLDNLITVTVSSSSCLSSTTMVDSSIETNTIQSDSTITMQVDSTSSDDISPSDTLTASPSNVDSSLSESAITSTPGASTSSQGANTAISTESVSTVMDSSIESMNTDTALDPSSTTSNWDSSNNVPGSSSACSCLCRSKDGRNITDEERAEEKAEEIKSELKVNTEKLSATIRKKISAEDNRPSAQGVGFVGVFFLTIVFSSLILLDITSLGQHLSMMKNNLLSKEDAP